MLQGEGESTHGSPKVIPMRKQKKASVAAAGETEGRMAQREVGKEGGAVLRHLDFIYMQ